MDQGPLTIGTVAIPGVALVVMIWAGWYAVVRPPPPQRDCSVGDFNPGVYQLDLVATDGPKSGSKSSGTLTLRCASPEDTSLDGKRVPDPTCNGGVHFYGFTDLDFKTVAAPVDDAPPLPTSDDPVWPGVVGWVALDENAVLGFFVGTDQNRRDECGGVQGGAGIFLRVYGAPPRAEAWTWKPWGDVQGGSGTFTMRYIGPE